MTYQHALDRVPLWNGAHDYESLVLGHLRLAVSVARRYAHGQHLDDAIQDANVGLCKAAQSWDADKDTFHNYATFKMRSEIRNQRPHLYSSHPKHEAYRQSRAVEVKDVDKDGLCLHLLSDSAIQLEMEEYVSLCYAIGHVPERPRMALMFRLWGHTLQETADEMGITHQGVSFLLAQAIKQLQEVMQ